MKFRAQKPLAGFANANVPIIGTSIPKVALGYCFGTLHWPFVKSLLAQGQHDLRRTQQHGAPYVWHHIPQPGLYIAVNRNTIAEQFLKTDAEWLLQIDTDIQFPPDIVERMLEAAGRDRKIVAASVPLGWSQEHGIPLPSTALMHGSAPGEWEYVPAEHWCPTCGDRRIELRSTAAGYQCTRDAAHMFAADDALVQAQFIVTAEGIEADALATAIILIHRTVLEDIADRFGRCWFLHRRVPRVTSRKSLEAWKAWKEKYGDFQRLEDDWAGDASMRDREFVSVGEDISFCLRASDVGHKSYCVKIPGLRHFKAVPLSHDTDPVEQPEAAPRAAEA